MSKKGITSKSELFLFVKSTFKRPPTKKKKKKESTSMSQNGYSFSWHVSYIDKTKSQAKSLKKLSHQRNSD